jgi:hypothetical protein
MDSLDYPQTTVYRRSEVYQVLSQSVRKHLTGGRLHAATAPPNIEGFSATMMTILVTFLWTTACIAGDLRLFTRAKALRAACKGHEWLERTMFWSRANATEPMKRLSDVGKCMATSILSNRHPLYRRCFQVLNNLGAHRHQSKCSLVDEACPGDRESGTG